MFASKNVLSVMLLVSFFPIFVSAAARNTTVDDHDYNVITYSTAENWGHDPLQGYEAFFVNGTRSFTYAPGASATFSFTGTGIYLQGPFSNDQAMRQVTLDGQDMGIYNAYAVERLPSDGTSAVFWGKSGLADTNHTVVITHADTTDKILVLDAWIFESDSSETQPPNTRTTIEGSGSLPTSGPSVSSTAPTSMSPNIGIIAGAIIAILAILFCLAGFFLLRRRRQRKRQQNHESNKEKIFRLSGPVYPAPTSPHSAVTKDDITDWRATIASAVDYNSSGDSNRASTSQNAGTGGGGAALPSHPSQPGGRAAADLYNDGGALGLTNHPLFLPTPLPSTSSASSESLYPTPPPYAGAPMLYFEQRPDPPPHPEYTGQPIINAPEPPSALRRLSTTIAGVLPVVRIGSPVSLLHMGGRRRSIVYDANGNGNSNGIDLERNGGSSPHARDSTFSGGGVGSTPSRYPPTSPTSPFTPIPLSPISATAGFARQSQNLEKLEELKYDEPSYDFDGDTLGTKTPERGANRSSERISRADPFADEFAFSSYTRLTRDEVLRGSPAGNKHALE